MMMPTPIRPKLSITTQLLLLLLVALILAQAINLLLLFGDRQLSGRSYTADVAIENIVKALKSIPAFDASALPLDLPRTPDQRGPTFISTRERAVRSHSIEPLPWAAERLKTALDEAEIAYITASAGTRPLNNVPPRNRRAPTSPSFRVPKGVPDRRGIQFADMEDMVFSVQFRPGVYVNRMVPYYPVERILTKIAFTILLTTAIIGTAAIFIARRITRPLRRRATTAEQFGRGEVVEPVELQGPREIRTTVEAFNIMQDRLRRLIETLRFTLRALSHDLRSPLTSLHFRTRALEDPAEREKMKAP